MNDQRTFQYYYIRVIIIISFLSNDNYNKFIIVEIVIL